MTNKTRPYREMLLGALTNPSEAAHYLNAALEDSHESFLKALKNVAQAYQMAKVARDAGVQRETLYRSLSSHGNPTLDTLSSILKAVGLKIVIGRNEEESPALTSLPHVNQTPFAEAAVVLGVGQVASPTSAADTVEIFVNAMIERPYRLSSTGDASHHFHHTAIISASTMPLSASPCLATVTEQGGPPLNYQGPPQTNIFTTALTYTGDATLAQVATNRGNSLVGTLEAGGVEFLHLTSINAPICGGSGIDFQYVGVGPSPLFASARPRAENKTMSAGQSFASAG